MSSRFLWSDSWRRGVNRFSDRRIWPQKSHGLWIFAVNRADWRILKTLDRESAVIFGADSGLCLSYVRILNEIWIIDLSSALVGMLLSSSKLFPLSKEVIVIGTALCYSHQVCCLLYYLDRINSGIYMYQFTFKPLHFCFRMCLWFRIWTKILADRRIWCLKGTDRRICIPLFTPLLKRPFFALILLCHTKTSEATDSHFVNSEIKKICVLCSLRSKRFCAVRE